MKRSLSLDFLRGFAVWMMIVFHVFIYSWDGIDNLNDVDYILDLPALLLILADYYITEEEGHVKESLNSKWSLFMIILTIIWFDLIL